MKNYIATSLFSLYGFFTHAQPLIQWQKTLGGSVDDYAFSLQITADGGYLVGGESKSYDWDVSGNHGGWDFWIIRLDGSSNILWSKTYGGTYDEYIRSVTQTSYGTFVTNFVAAGGTTSNDGDVNGNHGNEDAWIIYTDDSGTLLWTKTLGGTKMDQANYIKETTDGGFIVAGESNSTDGDVLGNHGARDFWIVRLDSYGNMTWNKSYGGSDWDIAEYILQTNDGGFAVAGYTESLDGDVTGNHGKSDFWLIRLDGNGYLLWQKAYGGSGFDEGMGIVQNVDGGFCMTGRTSSNDGDVSGNHGTWDYWVVRMDIDGNILWSKTLGGTSDDRAFFISQTLGGEFLVAGDSKSNDGDVYGNHGDKDCWIVLLDYEGDKLWAKTYGGSGWDIPWSFVETTPGSFALTGSTGSSNGDVSGNHGMYDIWLVSLSDYITGTQQVKEGLHLNMFPSPVSDNLIVEVKGISQGSLHAEIINSAGQKIFCKRMEANKHVVFDMKGVPSGIYLFRIVSGKETYLRKIVKY